jgi:formylglycine-generating enzyme required for sulfatase activity
MPETVRVFVSYASQDRAFAEQLVNDLRAAGAEVWWDVTGVNEGDFLDKINEALQQCQWLALALTPSAMASKWVKIEVNAAINRREKGLMRGVLPVLASPIAHDAMPPVWDNLHHYDAVANYSGEMVRLIKTLGLSGAPAEQPQAQPAAPAAPPHAAPPDRFPTRLASLGYRVAFLTGAEVILPPFCDVPAGPFLMGSDPKKDKEADKDRELPQHSVTLTAFQIGTYPVTVAEYACFVRVGQQEPKGPFKQLQWAQQVSGRLDQPVINVSWQDVTAYARWLAERTGQPWRLPSEAEWEKAARGTDGRMYPWGDRFDVGRCNTRRAGKRGTTPIGGYPGGASPCGAQDMAGNVWEWTSSVVKPYPYNATDGRERANPTEHRVLRGGSCVHYARFARAAYRNETKPDFPFGDAGFRLARSVPSA